MKAMRIFRGLRRRRASATSKFARPRHPHPGGTGSKPFGVTLNELGMVSTSLGETAKAIEYYEQAIDVWHGDGDPQARSSLLNNLGSAYRNLSQFDKALESLTQSLELRRELGDRAAQATTLGN